MCIVLQFSGGKDSLACLMLNRDRWQDKDFYVMWLNTGAAYPSVIEYMAGWSARVRNFVEVRSNQPEQIMRIGIPSDVVPIRFTHRARHFASMESPYLIQSYMDCCAENRWLPMMNAVRELGASVVIRGQRDDESRKSAIRDGHVEDGITYRFPIQSWSAQDVLDYLDDVGEPLPEYYRAGEKTSRDCWDCTAYSDESAERIAALPDAQRGVVEQRLKMIREAVEVEMIHVR